MFWNRARHGQAGNGHHTQHGNHAGHGGNEHACTCSAVERSQSDSLADVEPGCKVSVCCLKGEGRLIRRLSEMGFIPGTLIEVLRRAPMHDPIEFELRGYLVSLRREEADCISVKAEVPPPVGIPTIISNQ